MSWEDTNCPCGGKKDRETMLCAVCQDHLRDHPDMRVFRDESYSVDARRGAAIRILAAARRRPKAAQGALAPDGTPRTHP